MESGESDLRGPLPKRREKPKLDKRKKEVQLKISHNVSINESSFLEHVFSVCQCYYIRTMVLLIFNYYSASYIYGDVYLLHPLDGDTKYSVTTLSGQSDFKFDCIVSDWKLQKQKKKT
jgi:hypothetical protein